MDEPELTEENLRELAQYQKEVEDQKKWVDYMLDPSTNVNWKILTDI